MTNDEQVLLESQTARNTQIAQIEDRAEELLSKAKALHFNVWQGTGITTTEQVAEFYEVSIETVSKAAKRHRVEFESDGLKVLRGKDLGVVMDKLSITNKTRNLTIWNPRSTLRLGYLLRDSAIAKAVRTTSLDFIEQAAHQTPPKTQAEINLVQAQLMVDREKWEAETQKWKAESDQRFQSLESKVQKIEQIRIDATNELHQLPPSKEPAPQLTERASLRQLINKWCKATNVDQHTAWTKLYSELYYRDGFSVNARMKNGQYAKKIDAIVDCGKMSVLYAIACDIFRNDNSQGGSHA
jgi:hypothetical protein